MTMAATVAAGATQTDSAGGKWPTMSFAVFRCPSARKSIGSISRPKRALKRWLRLGRQVAWPGQQGLWVRCTFGARETQTRENKTCNDENARRGWLQAPSLSHCRKGATVRLVVRTRPTPHAAAIGASHRL